MDGAGRISITIAHPKHCELDTKKHKKMPNKKDQTMHILSKSVKREL